MIITPENSNYPKWKPDAVRNLTLLVSGEVGEFVKQKTTIIIQISCTGIVHELMT